MANNDCTQQDIILMRRFYKYMFFIGLSLSIITYMIFISNKDLLKMYPLTDGYVCIEPRSNLTFNIPNGSIGIHIHGNMSFYKFGSLDISFSRNGITTYAEDMHIDVDKRSTFHADSVGNDKVIITNIYTLRRVYVEVKYQNNSGFAIFMAVIAAISLALVIVSTVLFIIDIINRFVMSLYNRRKDRNKKLY